MILQRIIGLFNPRESVVPAERGHEIYEITEGAFLQARQAAAKRGTADQVGAILRGGSLYKQVTVAVAPTLCRVLSEFSVIKINFERETQERFALLKGQMPRE